MILGVPWWVFVLVILIFLSGYMALRAMHAERKLEQQFIEKEGKVYMDRLEAERVNKRQQKEHISD
ncbi:sporulation YhaL family protein [Oceanobacillus kapialis]|uniref:sporulation YhaL family protein n=1 Tax=Oceanobacillus kapialis TaxID=481353 RepID=UPI00384B577C